MKHCQINNGMVYYLRINSNTILVVIIITKLCCEKSFYYNFHIQFIFLNHIMLKK